MATITAEFSRWEGAKAYIDYYVKFPLGRTYYVNVVKWDPNGGCHTKVTWGHFIDQEYKTRTGYIPGDKINDGDITITLAVMAWVDQQLVGPCWGGVYQSEYIVASVDVYIPKKPECEEVTHEVLEYCPDGITEKRWRDCISGAWVEDSRVCPECYPEGAHEVLEYCPDGVTEKRWRDCVSGKWVEDSQICPECYPEGSHEVLEYCPDGITEKRWKDCVSGVWVEDSQVCPCSPEGAHEVLEYCLDEVTEKRWRDCISGAWVEYFLPCPACIEGERDVIEYCPDGVTWRLWWECIEEEWEHKSQKCPPAEGDRKCINFDLYEYQSGEWVLIEPHSFECLLCPIAVIAQGTELVDALGPIREFRDRYLKSNRVGRKFVSFYYGALTSRLSPLLMHHNQLKRVGRMIIVHPLKKLCEAVRRK